MQDDFATGPAPGVLSSASRVWVSLALLVATLLMTVPIYADWLSGNLEPAFRFGFAVLWGGLSVAATRTISPRQISTLLLSLFGVSLGFAFAYVVGSSPLDWLGLSWATPQ